MDKNKIDKLEELEKQIEKSIDELDKEYSKGSRLDVIVFRIQILVAILMAFTAGMEENKFLKIWLLICPTLILNFMLDSIKKWHKSEIKFKDDRIRFLKEKAKKHNKGE